MAVELKLWRQELASFQNLFSETLTQSRKKNVENTKIACDRSVDAVVCQLRALQDRVVQKRNEENCVDSNVVPQVAVGNSLGI